MFVCRWLFWWSQALFNICPGWQGRGPCRKGILPILQVQLVRSHSCLFQCRAHCPLNHTSNNLSCLHPAQKRESYRQPLQLDSRVVMNKITFANFVHYALPVSVTSCEGTTFLGNMFQLRQTKDSLCTMWNAPSQHLKGHSLCFSSLQLPISPGLGRGRPTTSIQLVRQFPSVSRLPRSRL
jgi:hypothetical protein